MQPTLSPTVRSRVNLCLTVWLVICHGTEGSARVRWKPTERSGPTGPAPHYDVIVVGAGFAGLYALYRLRKAGLRVHVLDAAPAVGGTWYWNAYPGARCDVESLQYSYSFSPELDQEWQWTQRYASQPDILAYLNHVADRFDLRRDITLNARVESAAWDEAEGWITTTEGGHRVRSQFLVLATGSLSAPLLPAIPGVERFAGQSFLTQAWPREPVDFAGRHVAVIGTGSSGVQAIPEIAAQAGHLTVFQRTPNFSAPGRNRPLDTGELAAAKARYPQLRAHQRAAYGCVELEVNRRTANEMTPEQQHQELRRRWVQGGVLPLTVAFRDVYTNLASNELVQDFIRAQIRAKVDDPALAETLCPSDHPFGGKRPCVDHGYFETYNRPNVTLVNVRDNPIQEITDTGIHLTDGTHHTVDTIVYATGYDAITGALSRIDIRGRNGISLREEWTTGPRTYLGLSFAGFPNLFSVAGPGSPAVLTMMIALAEQQIDWIATCINHLNHHGVTSIEATRPAQDEWTAELERAAHTAIAYTLTKNSYYNGANVPGKPQSFAIYVAGMPTYRRHCDNSADSGYTGFDLTHKDDIATAVAEPA